MRKVLLLISISFISLNLSAQLNIDYYLNKGRAELFAEKFNDAIESFNIVIKVKPELASPYFLRGIAKYNLMDYIGAEQDYSRAIEYKSNHTDALRYRGYTRINLKKYYLAIIDFDNAIKLNAIQPDFYVTRGYCRISINQYEQAIVDFNRSLDITKKNKRAYFYRGLARKMLEDTTGALVDFQTALDQDPEFSDVYMNRGILYSEWSKHDTAIINYNKVIELNPLDAGAYINRSLSNYHLDKKDLTILDLDTAIQIEPDNSLALFNRALIKNETGKSHEAIKDLDKVIRLNPQNILTYFNRGLIKLKLHDLQGAFIDFTYAIDIYPNFAKAYLNRSIVRQKLNDISGALADKEEAEKIIENVRQNKDSYVSYADTTENFQKLITLKSSNRFYNNPLFNEQIIAENNYKMLLGEENSKYFERISVLSDEIELDKGNLNDLSIVIENDLQTIYEAGFITAEIERLEKEYSSSMNKANNLILSSIYKGLQKNFNGALSDLDLAIKNDPNNFLLYFNRANIRSEMIDYIKLLEQENEVMLTSPDGSSNINTIKSNESYVDYNQVIADYYKALQLSPDFHLSAFNLANTYLKTREYRKAIELYNEVIKIEPIFAEAFYNRGLTYIYLKESENGCMDMSVAGELGLQKAYTVIARFCEN